LHGKVLKALLALRVTEAERKKHAEPTRGEGEERRAPPVARVAIFDFCLGKEHCRCYQILAAL
jgi:hypothetical protein